MDNLSEQKISTVKEIMDKYKILRKYLPPNETLDNLKLISNDKLPPTQNFDSNSQYTTLKINAAQLELAKSVANKTAEIYNFYKNEEFRAAKKSYNSLRDFLSKSRTELIGEFKSKRQVEDALGLFAVGANNNNSINEPTVGAGCFVLIEIILM